ncbi:DUF5718 family protein [Thiomicrorhabdus arctica]|uniref:DUF5718 family protein n=1 Tax=Thiomicrorhabdus arctica TaxID=131540 RepID=UPI00036DDEA3|nr:DUF5718 family protein [Thiomicrorhabdus arctica]
MTSYSMSLADLKNVLCLGIAGNFAGHLEQAGETHDFVNVKTAETKAPKGLFPYYIPNQPGIIGGFPLSSTEIHYPKNLDDNAHLQAEPEVCILFDMAYQDDLVMDLQPKAFAVFNDCSIRKPGAKKISEKKNWGSATKGISDKFLPLTGFEMGCELDTFHIASFLKRDGQIYAYGQDSSVLTYSFFHNQLKNWMIEQLNVQADFGPLENLQQIIQECDYPAQIMVSLGATAYTEFGESVFLEVGDELFFYAYDASLNSADEVYQHITGKTKRLINSSILHQKIT